MIRLTLEDGKFLVVAMVPFADPDGRVTMRAQIQIGTIDGNRINVDATGTMQKDELAKLSRMVNAVGKSLVNVGEQLNPIMAPNTVRTQGDPI